MAEASLRNLAEQETPFFPIDYPASSPEMPQQKLLAAKAEEWAAWGTPPSMLDTIIELLDWYDGDPDLELIDADLEDDEGIGHDQLATVRGHLTALDPGFAMPGDYADDFEARQG